jgi:predicted GNAT family acetyltransferase
MDSIGEVVIDGVPHAIEIDPDAGRLEVHAGDDVAFTQIRLRDSVLSLIHTEVPPELRRRGIADAMTRAALEYARAYGLSVRPTCPFVRAYLRRHPEYQDLVGPT